LAGLISKKRGNASHRRLDETLRATAIQLIGAHYCDFGPTLAYEKLVELHSMQLSVGGFKFEVQYCLQLVLPVLF